MASSTAALPVRATSPRLGCRDGWRAERRIRIIEGEKSLKIAAQALELELASTLTLVGAQPKQQSQPRAVAVCDLCRVEDEAGRLIVVNPGDRVAPDPACGLDVETTKEAQAERSLRTGLENQRGIPRRADRCLRRAGSHRELLRAGQPALEVGEPPRRRKAGSGIDGASRKKMGGPPPVPGDLDRSPATSGGSLSS